MQRGFASAILALIGGAILGPWAGPAPQVPGYAEISSPAAGEIVSGIVTIQGTAAHPEFVRYTLAFAYPDDPTRTWFWITEAGETQVHDSRLGVWDTSGMTEGEYVLRLQVWTSAGEPLSATIANLHVRRNPAQVVPSPTAALAPVDGTPTAVEAIPSPTPPAEGTARVRTQPGRAALALAAGASLAAGVIGLFGAYYWIRRRARGGGLSRRRSRRRLRSSKGPGGHDPTL